MVAGQVIGTGEAMPPASDDDDVIAGLEPIRSPKHSRLRVMLAEREAHQAVWHPHGQSTRAHLLSRKNFQMTCGEARKKLDQASSPDSQSPLRSTCLARIMHEI